MAKVFVPTPPSPPPNSSTPAIQWLKRNFFNSPFSIVMTLLSVYVIWSIVPFALNWAILDATWTGTDRTGCDANPDGACWAALRVRFWQVMLGRFYGANPEEIWRPLVIFALFVVIAYLLLSETLPGEYRLYLGGFALIVFPVLTYGLIHGGMFGLKVAATSQWGGFMLTLILAVGGIVLAFPLGIVLALGRRSSLPVVQWLSITFIEFWRANPLITILFMASNLLPLFLPSEIEVDKVARALVAITLFQSAYTAEAIRGGLASIPKGQFEAADSLGFKYHHTMGLIVLPQALKVSIPAIVNTFIALFKDTTLVGIVGLLDVFRMAQTVSRSTEWKGFDYETYIFSALIFFMCCYGMSRYSQSIERKLNREHKD
ncbi:MAG: amino acid ABC transporter permease [Neomegalonema sp.]|nr:amino acid ABC transporter permease [Neomegalonema sp.]